MGYKTTVVYGSDTLVEDLDIGESADVVYDSEIIVTLESEGTKILNCANAFMKTDISVGSLKVLNCGSKIMRDNISFITSATSYLPEFTYTGTYELVEEPSGGWYIKFLSSGTLIFTGFKNREKAVDFCVAGGGGGAGGSCAFWAGGATGARGGSGAGGRVNQQYNIDIADVIDLSTPITISIGSGGRGGNAPPSSGGSGGNGGAGGTSSIKIDAATYSASGGAAGTRAYQNGSTPVPGTNGAGKDGGGSGGGGQGSAIFGDADYYGYVSNGGWQGGGAGPANSGQGGGSSSSIYSGGSAGGTGVVYLRNSRS